MPKKLIVPGKKLPGLLQPAGPIKPDLDIKLPPGVLVQSSVSSLFQPGRPGKPAVRPDDLLAVRALGVTRIGATATEAILREAVRRGFPAPIPAGLSAPAPTAPKSAAPGY